MSDGVEAPLLLSGISSTEQIVEIYDGNAFIGNAPVVAGRWQFPVPRLSIGQHSFTAKIGTITSNSWRITVVEPPFVDFTDFENGSWNGWVAGPAGRDLRLETGAEGKYLFNPTQGDGQSGVVLRKSLSGLKPGASYRFEIRCRQIVNPITQTARLALEVAGVQIAGVYEPLATWQALGGTVVANSSVLEFAIKSHQQSGYGNDYYIDNIQIAAL
ncbi:hypothetical protein ACIQAL_07610 [Pseudomonas sp. NPDC088368]|jgi:hypothetical protein|uniref:hypothetical protein n=1 Tax=Pseudomonas sp. NPDC088368 TaxID=3364453 RepID=UPI0037F39030